MHKRSILSLNIKHLFTDSLGRTISAEIPIIPLVSYNPDSKIWKCVGTGFFVNPNGGFVTAKHVFYDNKGIPLPTLYGIQSTISGERHVRSIRHLAVHPKADICLGMLGQRRIKGGQNIVPETTVSFTLDFQNPDPHDKIKSFAFPLTEREETAEGAFEFTFTGKWSEGEIVEYHEEGSPLVRNRCFQTTMNIDSGASGGPVIKGNFVIGINSSGMTVPDGETPISFITPINLILDLSVPDGDKTRNVKELIDSGFILVKQ